MRAESDKLIPRYIPVASGDPTDGDRGDINVTGGGATWSIDNSSVTYAKLQDVSATDKILGRVTAGAGDVEEISCTAAGRALLDDVDAAAQRTTLGLGSLATQNGTFSGTSSGTNTGDQDTFKTIAVSGQSNVVADAAADTLTLAAGSGITITTDAGTDTVTITASGGVTEGEYTPTLTNSVNTASSTAYECVYVRVGNTVTVYGEVDIDPTTGGGTNTYMDMSLPISSNLGEFSDLLGHGSNYAPYGSMVGLRIEGNVSDNRATFFFTASSTALHQFSFSFMYQVI